MAREYMTDAEVEQEIARLKESPHVILAKKEQQVRMRRRQYMYTLRAFERKGRELEAAGLTMEQLCRISLEDDES